MRWIRTADELDDLVGELEGYRAIAIDTEGDSLHHYREQVCLVQVAAYRGGAWLVDPLAIDDLGPLQRVLGDGRIVKVLHGGENDVTSLHRDFGFELRTVFDTSIAARLLGDRELGLQAMVRNELGIELEKGSQRDDWSKRPLTPRQEAYAISDVAHLFELAARLTARLHAAGRTEWAREEFEALSRLRAAPRTVDAEGFRKIKGAAKLDRRAQAVLRELHVWREARAAAADRPPFRIIPAEALIALAADPPDNLDEVAAILARHPKVAGDAEVVLDAIERARALPDGALPARERGERPVVSAAQKRRIDALRAWRDAEADRSDLDPAVVLSQKLIERIAAAAPRTLAELAAVEGIRRWRVDAWGPALLDATAAAPPR